MNLVLSDNKQENVGTVKAETPDGPFALGVTRPVLNRSYSIKNIVQLADAHTLNVSVQYASKDSKNENVGDFVLPERASRTQTTNQTIDFREIAILSERTVHDVHFSWKRDHAETIPSSNALAIIVKDAFESGGAQNHSRSDTDTYEFSNLVYFAGDMLTMRSGVQGTYLRRTSLTEDNFFGEFVFSDLASYRAGKPLKYRITCCDPTYRISQTQVALFSQNDFKVSKTFTLMLGFRYQIQTNIHDRNNFDPRVGFAYAIGSATVLRGGAGIFSQWVRDDDIQTYRQLDGQRLYELQVDNPGWPNPFAAGSLRPRSRRIVDPTFTASYYPTAQIGIERSLPKNLFITLAYDMNRGLRPARTRDLNAPLPGTGIKPFPDQGQIIQIQSTGWSWHHNIRATMRQRFSIFNINASYNYYTGYVDGLGNRNLALPTNSYDLRIDWGYAGSPHHSLTASLNSHLPTDVYLTTVINARSGNAYTVTTGIDNNKDGVINDRPIALEKNTEFGPGLFDIGFNVSKAFELNKGMPASPQVNIFANLNNTFNTTHPGTPSGVMTSPFFRKPYNATSPRTVELGMRFQF